MRTTVDITAMRFLSTILIIAVFLCAPIVAQDTHNTLDSSSAFYAGDSLNYVICPPKDFRMVTNEAIGDGYSFAYVPEGEDYETASIRIGLNIFKIKEEARDKFRLDDLIFNDTTAMRKHFGETLEVAEVESIVTDDGLQLRTLYLNDKTAFIPNVMISYFDGGSEVLIFDLSISEDCPRFKAEKVYLNGLRKLRALVRGELGLSETE